MDTISWHEEVKQLCTPNDPHVITDFHIWLAKQYFWGFPGSSWRNFYSFLDLWRIKDTGRKFLGKFADTKNIFESCRKIFLFTKIDANQRSDGVVMRWQVCIFWYGYLRRSEGPVNIRRLEMFQLSAYYEASQKIFESCWKIFGYSNLVRKFSPSQKSMPIKGRRVSSCRYGVASMYVMIWFIKEIRGVIRYMTFGNV